MPNVHTINDLQPDVNNDPPMNRNFLQNFSQNQDPEKENFILMLKNNLCPNLTYFSITIILSILILISFVIEIFIFGIQEQTPDIGFLTLKKEKTIDFIFSLDNIKKFKFWVFITNIFINGSFLGNAYNIISLLLFGSLIEMFLNKYIFLCIYILSNIFGNFAFIIFHENSKLCGTKVSLYGLIGGLIGFTILKWKSFGIDRNIKYFLVCQIIFLILIFVIFTDDETKYLILDYIAALLFGLFFAMVFADYKNPMNEFLKETNTTEIRKYKNKVKLIGGILVIIYGCSIITGFIYKYIIN